MTFLAWFSCKAQLQVLIRSFQCRYKPFVVAEVTLNDPNQSGGNIDPADSDKGAAFKQLAGFLGEKNDRDQSLSMTTPVFNKSKQGVMQFYIGEGYKVRPPAKKHGFVFSVLSVPMNVTFSRLLGWVTSQLGVVMTIMLQCVSKLEHFSGHVMPPIFQFLNIRHQVWTVALVSACLHLKCQCSVGMLL